MGVVNVSLTSAVIGAPPVSVVYQRYCPLTPPVAVRMAAAPEQMLTLAALGALGSVVIVAVTVVLLLSHVPSFNATK